MSDLGFNVWGAIAAVVGTVALVPVFIAWFNTRLPRARLPYLVDLLSETLLLFLAGLREDLFTDESELRHFHARVKTAKRAVDDIRAGVYGATTWRQDVKHWYMGLSGDISDLSETLNNLRANLANTQSGNRKLLAAQGYPSKQALSPYAQELLREYSEALLLPYPTAYASLTPDVSIMAESPATLSAISLPVAEPLSSGPGPLSGSAIGLSAGSDAGSFSPTSSPASTSSLLSGQSEKSHTISDADLKALLYIALSSLRPRPSQDVEHGPPQVAQDAPCQGISQLAPRPAHGLSGTGHRLPLRLAKRTGIKASLLYRPIVRRSLSAMGVASARPQPDPESLVSPGLGCGDQVLEG
ncbi:hypothetical protein C8Q70DRAFT_265796 [Cubamyces menziesii]|uniref:Uncharacterized protein n=1 Tax=Trametes cubensis TaxID=1111947 RepID=A0AAD7TX26_9APHY|nr:hypothetical protein C8Q70DRAFT_265796 [Cubamyces menziesii]KAJ8482813.1 hypothetical protein ONZ51_g5127 [Trametes cubensis]